MNSRVNHIIHKQTIEIRFANFTTANSWNATKQAETVEALHRSLERSFEEYDSTKEYLTIDKLEIDLGAFRADQLMTEMPEIFYRELQKIMNSYHVTVNDFTEERIDEDISSTDIWSTAGADKRMPGSIIRNSETKAFQFYLQHGYLPWWYSNEPAWNIEWLQQLTGDNWQELRNFLRICRENMSNDETPLLRLISQFNDSFLTSLLNGLQLKEPVENALRWLKRFYETLQKAETTSLRGEGFLPSFSVLRRHFWINWISHAVDSSGIPQLAILFDSNKERSLITSILSAKDESNEWINTAPEYWRSELISLKHDQGSTAGLNSASELVNEEVEKFNKSHKAHTDKDDFILIPDSGLVLLHPFLPRFFEYCMWIKENKFLNDKARNRAVNALHYLTTGDEEAPEYVLMLPKLLCGISLEWPLEYTQPLTDAEKAACDELLVQVIGHWSALRNTSPAALRETFLRRPGKLFLTDHGWRLEVQRKTEDILLGRLPWGFSMIKYSWMPQVLSVSWE